MIGAGVPAGAAMPLEVRSTFQYQNLGYLVAGMVAERISGQHWTVIYPRPIDRRSCA